MLWPHFGWLPTFWSWKVYEVWRRTRNNIFEIRKKFVHENLNKINNISCFKPGGAFYAFPNISETGLSDKKYSDEALYNKGVAVVPGSSFGDNASEFVRISFANSLENIKEAINRLSTIWKK